MTFFERKRVRDKLQHNQIEPAKEGNISDITIKRRETKDSQTSFFLVEQRFEIFCKSNIKFV